MASKLAALTLSALLLLAVAGCRPVPLTVQVGSGPIALVQASSVVLGGGLANDQGKLSPSLAASSTAGTTLIAVLAALTGTWTGPTGFTQLVRFVSSNVSYEVWAYPNNPGGILAATFQISAGNFAGQAALSEWSNVRRVGTTLDASGSAAAAAGTTLAPATTGLVSAQGEVAITGWTQQATGSGAVTFTSPPGWTRLQDSSSGTGTFHTDIEYLLNPPLGGGLGPTLTSTATTAFASGVVVTLFPAPVASDTSAYVEADSVNAKLNTASFGLVLGGKYQLEDGSGFYQLEDASGMYLLDTYVPQLGDPVTITNPTWSGRVVNTHQADIVNLVSNYQRVSVDATNATAAPGGTAPGNFANPQVGGYYQLEDGSGSYQLEDGTGDYVLEATGFPYRNLQLQKSQNQDGTTTTYGTLETFEGGYAAGMAITLSNTNLGLAAVAYTITNVHTTFIGTGPPTPVYLIEFGDAYQTLQKAGGGVLTQVGSQAAIQQGTAVPAGTLGYAQVTASQTGISGVTDLTGLSVTVTVGSSRRVRVAASAQIQQQTAGGSPILSIKEGATVLNIARITLVAGGVDTVATYAILTPTAGVHTYKLTLEAAAGTVDLVASSTNPAFITVEDIGI